MVCENNILYIDEISGDTIPLSFLDNFAFDHDMIQNINIRHK